MANQMLPCPACGEPMTQEGVCCNPECEAFAGDEPE